MAAVKNLSAQKLLYDNLASLAHVLPNIYEIPLKSIFILRGKTSITSSFYAQYN